MSTINTSGHPARLPTVAAIRGSDRGYTAFHAPRYRYLLGLLHDLGANERTRFLDIGRSQLTTLVHETFGARVDTLGFDPEGETAEGRHYHYDLNQAQWEERWRRDLPTYDVIVMAEVIEHLYTAPQLVLRFLRSLLADDGRLIVQTPNAAALAKRLKLLLGRNPHEMIRVDPTDPGHFREYTPAELRTLAREAGMTTERSERVHYFDSRFSHHGEGGPRPQPVVGTVKNVVYSMLPAALRLGMTVVLRPAGAERPGR